MPAKNIVKQFASNSYYHVYNRGVAKQKIFLDQSDKSYFLSLLDRHLNLHVVHKNKLGAPYKKFNDVELTCYCLMGNHYHFVFWQGDNSSDITELMRSLGTSYTMYFNHKYKRVGPLFQGTYKASHILNESYLLHISRYIHLNPRYYENYHHSSLRAYTTGQSPPWLKPDKVLNQFEGEDYLEFVRDYEDRAQLLEEIKSELANT